MKPSVGDRVRTTAPLVYGPSKPGELDPESPPVGSMGTVDWVNTWESWLTQQYGVKWDEGVCGPPNLLGEDPVEVVPQPDPDGGIDLTDEEFATYMKFVKE